MIFSRWVRPEATRDLSRILSNSPAAERPLLEDCYDILFKSLRYDPHLQGDVGTTLPFRVITCGLLRLYFRPSSPDDRYVEISGVGRNPNWVP